LEALLAAKNKRIMDELAKFRVRTANIAPSCECILILKVQILHGELEASLQQARSELTTTSVELEKQRELNERLENDLLTLAQRSRTTGSAGLDPDAGDDGDDGALAGLALGKKAKPAGVSSLFRERFRRGPTLTLSVELSSAELANTIHFLGGHINFANRDEPTRSFPATKR
jgi:hypothetical protein